MINISYVSEGDLEACLCVQQLLINHLNIVVDGNYSSMSIPDNYSWPDFGICIRTKSYHEIHIYIYIYTYDAEPHKIQK